jgi:hypothetical protein
MRLMVTGIKHSHVTDLPRPKLTAAAAAAAHLLAATSVIDRAHLSRGVETATATETGI